MFLCLLLNFTISLTFLLKQGNNMCLVVVVLKKFLFALELIYFITPGVAITTCLNRTLYKLES